jgi:hypothetical protein
VYPLLYQLIHVSLELRRGWHDKHCLLGCQISCPSFRNNVAVGGIGDTAGFWATPNGSTDTASTLFTQNESHSNRYGFYYSGKTELTIANDQAFIWNNTTGVNAVHAVNATTQSSLFWGNKDVSSLPQPGTFTNNTIIPNEVVVVPPDTTPPVISNRSVSEITTTQTTIRWETNEPATHKVEYGTTVSYGQAVNLPDAGTIPRAVITGLTPDTLYHYRVRSRDAAGNESNKATGSGVTSASSVADTERPTTPGPLILQPSAVPHLGVAFSWGVSTDNIGVTGYKIYRNGNFLVTFPSISGFDSAVVQGATYSYTVAAIDAAGNESVKTAPLVVTIPLAPNTQAPAAPTNLSASNITQTSFILS